MPLLVRITNGYLEPLYADFARKGAQQSAAVKKGWRKRKRANVSEWMEKTLGHSLEDSALAPSTSRRGKNLRARRAAQERSQPEGVLRKGTGLIRYKGELYPGRKKRGQIGIDLKPGETTWFKKDKKSGELKKIKTEKTALSAAEIAKSDKFRKRLGKPVQTERRMKREIAKTAFEKGLESFHDLYPDKFPFLEGLVRARSKSVERRIQSALQWHVPDYGKREGPKRKQETPPNLFSPGELRRAYTGEHQKELDKLVKEIHAKWVKAGKPSFGKSS